MCLNDFRYSARAFRKNPGFAILPILTIALGIGASTSTFTAVKGVFLKARKASAVQPRGAVRYE
jgi:hypothetical protein